MELLMCAYRQRIGNWGEKEAEKYLIEHGCSILDRNVRTQFGEVDIIALDENCMVFVEVKTRTNDSFGKPEESITTRKKEHMIHSAEAYLIGHPEIDGELRIDVIAIEGSPLNSSLNITWFKNV
jgi:putative endonuclease